MKILVAIKQVIDPYVRIRVKADHSGIQTDAVKHSINPFDEVAVEESIRLKEKGYVSEIIVVCLGPTQDVLRHALSLGADRAIHIVTDAQLESLTVAKTLKAVVLQEDPQMVLLGKQAIDDDCNQVGQMLAALLEWPQVTFASQISCEENYLSIVREVDGGLETLHVSPPVVITVDLCLNTPRYATLPNIVRARQKPLSTVNFSDTGLSLEPRLTRLSVTEPPLRKKGLIVTSVKDLVERLKQEGLT